jgi:hypothetical protein
MRLVGLAWLLISESFFTESFETPYNIRVLEG